MVYICLGARHKACKHQTDCRFAVTVLFICLCYNSLCLVPLCDNEALCLTYQHRTNHYRLKLHCPLNGCKYFPKAQMEKSFSLHDETFHAPLNPDAFFFHLQERTMIGIVCHVGCLCLSVGYRFYSSWLLFKMVCSGN